MIGRIAVSIGAIETTTLAIVLHPSVMFLSRDYLIT